MNNKRKVRKIKPVYLVLLVVLVGLVPLGVFAYKNYENGRPDNIPPGETEKINYTPPTQAEHQETTDHKESLGSAPANTTTTVTQSDGRKTVKPILTFVGYSSDQNNIEVSSFVPGIIEEGGQCTLTATKDTQTVTRKTGTLRSASSTGCKNFVIPNSEYPTKGSWKITVTYSSGVHYGTSDTSMVEVN